MVLYHRTRNQDFFNFFFLSELIQCYHTETFQARYWFGEDGRLITLPDPVKEVSSRPIIMEQLEQQLFVTEYRKV